MNHIITLANNWQYGQLGHLNPLDLWHPTPWTDSRRFNRPIDTLEDMVAWIDYVMKGCRAITKSRG